MPPERQRRPGTAESVNRSAAAASPEHTADLRDDASLPGWSVRCPFCWRLVLPTDASLHYVIAPRLAFHMLDEHPAEATMLRLRLNRPPAEWPVEVAA